MTSHSADLTCPGPAENTPALHYGHLMQMLPVTLTVVLGPLVAVLYHLTQSSNAGSGSFSLAQAVRGLFCALMLLSLFCSGGLRLAAHRLVRPLVFLSSYAVLTAFARPYPYEDIVFAVKMAFVGLIFMSALQLAGEGRFGERWLATCAWIVLLVMVACIGTGLVTGRTVAVYQSRYATAGLMNHVSVASFFILSTLPVFSRHVAATRSALAGTAILYTLLFFTMCRSAIIAAVVATVCCFLLYLHPPGGRIPWRRILVAVALLLLLAGLGLSTGAGADLIARFQDLRPHGGTGSGRYVFWKISLEHILHRPLDAQLWGEGTGRIRDLLQKRFGMAIASHNDWLDLIHAFGVCGLIGLGWWFWELARLVRLLRGRREGLFQGACAAGIILILLSLGTGGSFEPSLALIYAALGFWAGLAGRAEAPCGLPVD